MARNAERAKARNKAKGGDAGSPLTAGSPLPTEGLDASQATSASEKPDGRKSNKERGTQRKCANCGQVGHIKTNKKFVVVSSPTCFPSLLTLRPSRVCPKLNGTWDAQNQNGGNGGGMANGDAGGVSFAANAAPLTL